MPSVIRDAGGMPLSVSFPTRADNPPGVFDFFMPYRAIWHNFDDFDLGSSGVLLVPGTRELVIAGKEGILYVLSRDSMKGYDTNHWLLSDYDNACRTKITVCGET